MKKIMLLTCLTFLVLGCQKDEQRNSALLINSWTRLYQASDASFNVKLSFNADGSFSWEMIDIVPTHSNSYAEYIVSETEITISSDPECPGEGVYGYTIKGDQLTISLINDACSPRSPAFSGVWKRM